MSLSLSDTPSSWAYPSMTTSKQYVSTTPFDLDELP